MTNRRGNVIKTPQQIQIMREAGKILATILNEIKKQIKPNVETLALEDLFIKLTKEYGVIPACKGYGPYGLPPFPTGICLSINNESVHCFPKKGKIIKEGDLVNVDTTISLKGMHVDSAFAVGVGNVSPQRKALMETSERALYSAIDKVKNGVKIGVISDVIYKTAKSKGFDVLRDYAGHGIGTTLHEYPDVPCYGSANGGAVLQTGMTICIEPLMCAGKPHVKNLSLWETQMADGKDFAQFEHTILVTEDGCELLTNGRIA